LLQSRIPFAEWSAGFTDFRRLIRSRSQPCANPSNLRQSAESADEFSPSSTYARLAPAQIQRERELAVVFFAWRLERAGGVAGGEEAGGAAAFGFASPGIREHFGTAENFMRMVRSGYQPVYRPREVQFGTIATVNGDIVQRVELIGPDGKPALALYVMQRQPDGNWKINGCFLTTSEQRTT